MQLNKNNMKNIVYFVACMLALVSCTHGVSQGSDAEDTIKIDGYADFDLVSQHWKNRVIKVDESVDNPTVETFLRAFHAQWPTSVVSIILGCIDNDPNFEAQFNEDVGGGIVYSRELNCMNVSAGDTDDDSMDAKVWNCENGHQLFTVLLHRPTPQGSHIDPLMQAVCFYDYDPKEHTLTPVATPMDDFTPTASWLHVAGSMDGYYGGDFAILELDQGGLEIIYPYKWDGKDFEPAPMWFEPSPETLVSYDQELQDDNVKYTQYALMDIDGDEQMEIWARDESKKHQALFYYDHEAYHFKRMTTFDDRATVAFYAKGVIVSGSCGSGCEEAYFILIDHSQPVRTITHFRETTPNGDVVNDDYADGDNLLDEEEMNEFRKQQGKEQEVKVKWLDV